MRVMTNLKNFGDFIHSIEPSLYGWWMIFHCEMILRNNGVITIIFLLNI